MLRFSKTPYRPVIVVVVVVVAGDKMHLQGLTSLQVHNSTLEAFTQAALILALAVAIIAANVILIAAIVNYRGEL